MSIKSRRWRMGLSAAIGALAVTACGSSSTKNDCTTGHANPTLTIGLSAADGTFLSPVTSGTDVKMTPGPQGGCHYWLAFRTDGLIGKGATIHYVLIDHDMGDQMIGGNVDVQADLASDPAAPAMCEVGAQKMFVLMASARENHHLKLTVTITDSSGATATQTLDNLKAVWPDVQAGQDRATLCGTM
jgi:hypothetical protein